MNSQKKLPGIVDTIILKMVTLVCYILIPFIYIFSFFGKMLKTPIVKKMEESVDKFYKSPRVRKLMYLAEDAYEAAKPTINIVGITLIVVCFFVQIFLLVSRSWVGFLVVLLGLAFWGFVFYEWFNNHKKRLK